MDEYNELDPVFQQRLDDACQKLFGDNYVDCHNGHTVVYTNSVCAVLLELVGEMNE